MGMLATLRQSGGINALARQLGAQPAQALAGAGELLPGLLQGFREFSGGIDGLLALVDSLGGGGLAAAVISHEPADAAPGHKILAGIPVIEASEGGAMTGEGSIDPDLRKRMMPLLAMLAGGYLAARAAGGGLPEGELAGLLDPGDDRAPPVDEPV